MEGSGEMSQYSVASEDRLLTTAQCGDQQAFIELYRRHCSSEEENLLACEEPRRFGRRASGYFPPCLCLQD